jgi:PAS domain S-box-containing protein
MDSESVAEQYRHLIELVDMMNCGLLVRDAGGTVVFANRALLRWLSYRRGELVGRPLEELFPPEVRQAIRSEIEATKKGDLRVRLVTLQRRDSSTFPAIVIPHQFLDPHGRPVGGFAIIVDLGAIQTAKPVGSEPGNDLQASLDRVSLQLQAIRLAAATGSTTPLPLHHPDLSDLSPRETEVLVQLMAGHRVPWIATHLHISPHTVRNHLKAMFAKLGVRSQAKLIQRVRSLPI